MIPALILVVWLCLTGWIFYAYHRRRQQRRDGSVEDAPDAGGEAPGECRSHAGVCCGLHAICEKGLPKSAEDLYFDDEELDRFAGRGSESYTPAEEDEFRDVMLTVPADELGLWARCMGMRRIQLPARVRDELLLLMRENG